jgi:hypothetical protein
MTHPRWMSWKNGWLPSEVVMIDTAPAFPAFPHFLEM